MNNTNPQNYRQDTHYDPTKEGKSPQEVKQEQTDPNLTELKGFVDPSHKLEPEGTHNDFGKTDVGK